MFVKQKCLVQSEVTYPNFSHPNFFVNQMHLAKPHPLYLPTFIIEKLVLAVKMADIKCFMALSTVLWQLKMQENFYGQRRLLNCQSQPLGTASLLHTHWKLNPSIGLR